MSVRDQSSARAISPGAAAWVEAASSAGLMSTEPSATPRPRSGACSRSTSGGEELQKALPRARVVKAFNTVFAQHMSRGSAVGQQLSLFAAGDDAAARKTVLELGKAIGFDAIDAGPLKNARHLEPLGYFNIQLGYVLGNGPDIGFKLVH